MCVVAIDVAWVLYLLGRLMRFVHRGCVRMVAQARIQIPVLCTHRHVLYMLLGAKVVNGVAVAKDLQFFSFIFPFFVRIYWRKKDKRWGKKGASHTHMPPGDEAREVAVALHLREKDDAVLCAFGRDFFDGARKGAASGGLFTAWLTRRTFIDLRDDYKEYEADLPRHMRCSSWTISRGFRTRPFFTLGCMSLALTTLLKVAKFTLANRRYQEFVADDVGFELLQAMCADSHGEKDELNRLLDVELGASKTGPVSTPERDVKTPNDQAKSLTRRLVAEAADVSERRAPTFWDGVAVGLLGSVMDCYLPSKPVYCYYGMRCGMRT